jgi:hypothetical protein
VALRDLKLSAEELEGYSLEWNDSAMLWQLKNDEGVFCTSKSLEGLETNFSLKLREVKKKGFRKDQVIVWRSQFSEPYVGEVSSRPSHHKVWVVRADETAESARKKEQVDTVVYSGSKASILKWTQAAFDILCVVRYENGEDGFRSQNDRLTPEVERHRRKLAA